MIAIILLLIAYYLDCWWLVFLVVAIDSLLQDREIKALEKRIEELENENLHGQIRD